MDDAIYEWTPRIGFALLLVVFGELVAWFGANQYSLVDWLAVAAIYLALTMISLDLLARFHSQTWVTLMLVAGVYGLIQSSLVSLGLFQNPPITVALFATGVQSLAFVLAYASFRLLYTGIPAERWLYALAPIVGLASGLWIRRVPKIENISLVAPVFGDIVPYAVFGLALAGLVIFRLPLPSHIDRDDWVLTPFGWAAAGLILTVTAILRVDGGYVSVLGLIAVVIVLSMICALLIFSRYAMREQPFRLAIRPQRETIIRWVFMMFPGAIAGWLGYQLADTIVATILVFSLVVFGTIWLPAVSVFISMRTFIAMERQEY